MKIVILGGAGGQGKFATEEILRGNVFDEIVVASRNLEKTQEYVDTLGDNKVKAAQVDIMNEENLLSLIKDADVVANCTGPFYLLGEKVIDAALKAEVDYIDFCDDISVFREVLTDKRNKLAKEKDITIIMGLGSSPGAMPLEAYAVAKELDDVDTINMYMAIDTLDNAEGAAVLLHVIENYVNEIDTIKDGEIYMEKPFEGAIMYDFKGPIGEVMVSTMSHPEVFTLPRVLPGIQNINIKLGFYPSSAFEEMKTLIELGMASNETFNIKNVKAKPRDFLLHFMMVNRKSDVERKIGRPITGSVIEVIGRKDNKDITYISRSFGNMGPATGYPLAIGAEMLATGKIEKKGIFVPEECIDPLYFLNQLVTRNAKASHETISKVEYHTEEVNSGEELIEKYNLDF